VEGAKKKRMRLGASSLASAVVLLFGQSFEARSQPLGVNPSAAPSDIGNPSSINPAARPSDIGNPSAINPAAAASQASPSLSPSRPAVTVPRAARQRIALPPRRAERPDRQKDTGERSRAAEVAPACQANKAKVANWQELREHLATCWEVPEGTAGSSVTLRFGISSLGELRGQPLITATSVRPKEMAAKYRKAATAVLDQCLPVCPTEDFGATLHESTMHLRLVNDAPFPSRNLGPWMTIFARGEADRRPRG
jgi:hypothetical protein